MKLTIAYIGPLLAQTASLLYRGLAIRKPFGTSAIAESVALRGTLCSTGFLAPKVARLALRGALFSSRLVSATLLFATLQLTAFSGTIVGNVRAQGKAGAPSESTGGGNYGSRQFKFVERVNYDEMRDFVVYIDGPVGAKPAEPSTETKQVVTKRGQTGGATVKQSKAMFDPHVLPVMVGTTVEWPNYDDILHNVFSFSEPKQFDLGLYKAPNIEKVKFDKPGRVDVFCSIHSRMNCIVLVLENPYFASANAKGNYSITNVPAGTYKLKAWHERLPPETKEVTVPETGEVKVDFVLGIKNLPKP